MCGIAGFSGSFDPALLSKMGTLIDHRGPDDAGEIFLTSHDVSVGLVHRRLSIIDLSADGKQPMTVNCPCCKNTDDLHVVNKLWLTYNGEIYNYKELRKILESKGHQFISQTDSEVLIHLFAEYGSAMLEKLNGIFAFALYDGRSKPATILLARDGVGTKPLYYSKTHSGIIFASELKALLACHELRKNLDLTAIHYYLAYLWCPGQQTALQNVKKLQPGEAMILCEDRIVKQWYFYDFPYGRKALDLSEENLSKQLDLHLTNAVTRQLISDVPVGAFLSGGLDSSAVVAMMRKLNPQSEINCYSIGFENNVSLDGSPNDLPYAKQVAKHLNVNLNIIEVKADMIQHLEKMLYYLDEPQADPAPINAFLIAQAARKDGIKVLLSGTGGDDIFSGYRRHQAMNAEKLWRALPSFIRRSLAKSSLALLEGKSVKHAMRYPLVRRLAKLAAYSDVPVDERIASHFLWSTERTRHALYSFDMAKNIENIQAITPLLESLKRIPAEKDLLNRILYLEGKHFLADHNLNYTDKVSMAAGVEVRVPLLDPDLIEFATRVPSHFKQRGKQGKYIFKKTMEPYLPKNIIYRPKTGFGAPLRRWLHQELKPLLSEILSESSIKSRGIFEANKISQLIKMDHAGKIDASYTIFSALCIELWCRTFVDAKY